MTKTEILTDITTKFADESNITAEELREVVEGIVNYLVPDVIDISHETPSTIIQFGINTEGFVSISKVGRLVTMYGQLTNVSGSPSNVGFEIIDEDYKPASASSGVNYAFGNGVYIDQSDSVFKPRNIYYLYGSVQTNGNIPTGIGSSVRFSITYLTNS